MPIGVRELERIVTVAVVIGEGAAECFAKGGVEELYQGSIESPARYKIRIMDFLCEDVIEKVTGRIRGDCSVYAPLVDVLVLRDGDERHLEWLISKGSRTSRSFFRNKEGELRPVKPERPCIMNGKECEYVQKEPSGTGAEIVYHDVTDILYKTNKGVFIHEVKGEPGQYMLDFNKMNYWKLGGLQPDNSETLPAYSSFRSISFGAKAYLTVACGSHADVLLNCSLRWTDYSLVLEVCRPFITGNGKTTMMYNFYIPPGEGKYLSPFWFNGVDTSGKSKLMDNRAYIKTLHGRQWYHIHYSGKVEKERFEPDGY